MRVLCVIVLLLFLSGCGGQAAWETVDDPWYEVVAPKREVSLKLPTEAAMPVLQGADSEKLYQCDDYTITVQTFESGDLSTTLRNITGFSRDQLTCIQTRDDEIKQYHCVWSAAGEGGDHVGRAVILDDGDYHYAVSVMAEFEAAGELAQTWQDILDSVALTDTD